MPIVPYKGYDLTVDGSSLKSQWERSTYELEVMLALCCIFSSQTGTALFHDFKGTGRSIKIVPEVGDGIGANARPASRDALPLREGCYLQESLDGERECSLSNWVGFVSPKIDAGRGSSSVIEFSMSKYHGKYPGSSPDEILFHEMVHALRNARGINGATKELLPGSIFRSGKIYENEEEFIAILITNIYRSEQQRPKLRMDHNGYSDLDTDTDETFLPDRDESDYRYRLVHKLVAQDPRLVQELQLIPSKFNPIRRFFQLQYPDRLISG